MRPFFAVIAIGFALGGCAAYEQQQRDQAIARAAARGQKSDPRPSKTTGLSTRATKLDWRQWTGSYREKRYEIAEPA
jgi:hypothetical protein